MPKVASKKNPNLKGPGLPTSLKNLEKARQALVDKKTYLNDMSLIVPEHVPEDMSEDMFLDHHKKTSNRIAYKLSKQVEEILEQASKSKTSKTSLLGQAYGFKSLSDTYMSYLKLQYPLGLDSRDSSQLSHLLGSILPQLKATLNIDLSTMVSPPPIKRHSKPTTIEGKSYDLPAPPTPEQTS